MKTALIFLNSPIAPTLNLSKIDLENSKKYFTDGAIRYAKELGITPDIIIGDLDSADPELIIELKSRGAKIICDSDQDYSDLEAAIDHAFENEIDRVQIIGSMDGRADHALTNFMILANPKYGSKELEIIDKNSTTKLLKTGKVIELNKSAGEILSIVQIQESIISMKGFKWELDQETIKVGSTIGLSNLITQEIASIEVHSGSVFAIQTSN
ncbi:MAG: thiamine diphosphokinase [Bdellovibrionota bacterium]